ncbi:hypothetical protein M3598_01130 [Cytobacillus oceanisediminis]|uniref:hypothetical protein n=1 Tax=Cytobacillus oceanisediminis TaxID=665099 RepID=UPI00203D7E69|nr:hypothetical protein [Cytobacillus oceanisediminis]MCM3241334.1 hypothetical protein [Cytobacillus oceanisediminis]
MNENVHLYLDGEKIGVINHQFFYDDEANSGRIICEGCLLVLHDFRYRVKSVSETDDGYEAILVRES